MTRPLSVSDVPLAGSMLVEASAGTGKTWTIAALHLRLLLEKQIPVERILVVTFGRAATAELKRRIHERLAEVGAALEAGDLDALAASDDTLLAHVARTTTDPKRDSLRLALALESFDLAPVLTIHGFCQRALAEHAFESGVPFETEVITDESALIEEVVRDFWRREIAAATPAWAQWLAAGNVSPATLARQIEVIQQRPYAGITGPAAAFVDGEVDLVAAHARARKIWFTERDAIRANLVDAGVWRKGWPESRCEALDAYFSDVVASPTIPEQLKYFAVERIAADFARKKRAVPTREFFAAADRLASSAAQAEAGFAARQVEMIARLAAFCREELAKRKEERSLLGYSDLLVRLRDALAGPSGDELARALAERYPAALIDEFQDTDPIQYEIFRRIYGGTDRPAVFVGDPKQAIYGFRGGDVNTYIAAREGVTGTHTLTRNFRSTPALVRAVNAVFGGANPFFDAGIDFHPAEPAEREQPQLVAPGGKAPLAFWFMPRGADGKFSKERANVLASQATAAEIASLLSAARHGEARLGDRALEGGDIAVLVASHRQGMLVRQALAKLGIPSVSYGQDSVFDSAEAQEFERVLAAVAEPTRESRVRVALATDLIGMNGDALAALDTDGDAWEEAVARFTGYHALALEHGFAAMWRALTDREGVSARLLGGADGERRLTNVRHIADLLQTAEAENGLDLEGLLRFLAHARTGGHGDADAQQIRLESDEHLVRILTVHASKGLEFPIVFCPFLWDGRLQSGTSEIVACHDDDGHALFDVGSEHIATHRAAAARESFAERLRLAYVALTRARCRCVVAWGAVNEAETSALAWLLHRSRDRAAGDLESWAQAFGALDDESLRADLERLAETSDGAIGVSNIPDVHDAAMAESSAKPAPLAARRFGGRIAPPWRVSSFSGLVARGESALREAERPDHDALWIAPAIDAGGPRSDGIDEAESRTIFDFPRGVRAGTLIHALFERMDFGTPESNATRRLVRETLAEFDFDPGWAPVLERLLVDVVSAPLPGSDGGESALRLSAIGSRQRIAELEFLFPVRHTPEALRTAFAPLRDLGSHLPGAVGRFIAAPARGFLRGFIDLVFEHRGRYYIADWKSNWLGSRQEDYAPERLGAAMADAYYDLQYLIYSVALHRHLAARVEGYDYGRHFGGVYYFFVRGMSVRTGEQSGVYFTRPERALIEQLDAVLGSNERVLP